MTDKKPKTKPTCAWSWKLVTRSNVKYDTQSKVSMLTQSCTNTPRSQTESNCWCVTSHNYKIVLKIIGGVQFCQHPVINPLKVEPIIITELWCANCDKRVPYLLACDDHKKGSVPMLAKLAWIKWVGNLCWCAAQHIIMQITQLCVSIG